MDTASKPKKVFIKTFGCQMNEYDSGKMRALLGHDGYVSVKAQKRPMLFWSTPAQFGKSRSISFTHSLAQSSICAAMM
jgi:hypothetical protein